MPFNVACSTLSCSAKTYPDLFQALRKIRDLGFASHDLAAFENWQNLNPSFLANASSAAVENLAHSLRKTGLNLIAINAGPSVSMTSPSESDQSTYRKEVQALIDFAYITDAKTITLQPPKRSPDPKTEERNIAQLIETAKEFGPKAKKKSIRLTFENHQGSVLENPKDALRFCETVSNYSGLTYDPSHFIMQGHTLEDTLSLIPYSPHIHLRNATLESMQANYPNSGHDYLIPLKNHLSDINYAGTLSIEYFNDFDPSFESVMNIKELFEQ
ncbi:MAG: sugar phosphate isomerase/epimerase family protein [Verrucomicrobiota bacterium]